MDNSRELTSYRKKNVDAYIAQLESDHRDALAAKDAQIAELNNKNATLLSQYNELQSKCTALSSEIIDLQRDKTRVANVLLGAEETAASIIEQARGDADRERTELLAQLERLREEVIDRNRMIGDLKRDIITTCEELKSNFFASCDKLSASLDEGIKLTESEFGALQSRYAVPEPSEQSEPSEQPELSEQLNLSADETTENIADEMAGEEVNN